MLRWLAILSVAAAAVTGGAVAGGSTSGGPFAGGAVARGTSPAAPPPDVPQLVKVGLRLGYYVSWTENLGSKSDDCSTWSVEQGTLDVDVRSSAKKPIPGGFVYFGAPSHDPRYGGWADGSAVGRAKATVHRTLVETAGVTQCGAEPARLLPPKANDCGEGRGQVFHTRSAAIRPELRQSLVLLKDVTRTIPANRSRLANHAVFAITVVGPTPYRNCKMTRWAPALPANMAVEVDERDYVALRKLMPGKRYTVSQSRIGACDLFIDRPDSCTFKLDIALTIRRLRPGERFP